MDPDKLNQPYTLFYLPVLNRFVDDEWYIVHDLNRLFGTWQLDKFKKTKGTLKLEDKNRKMWTLYYLDEFEAGSVYDLIAWNESYDINMIREGY